MRKDLPNGWTETDSGDLFYQLRGLSYKKDQAFSVRSDGDVLVLRGGNIQDGKIIDSKDDVFVSKELVKESQFLKAGDVIIVSSTGSKKLIGKAAHSEIDYTDTTFGAFLTLLRPNKLINSKYFDYFYQTDYYRNSIRELSSGININNIRKDHLAKIKFPLAPLPEQKRIVTKLDFLFMHMDTLKTKLDRIPELLKNFRQQVLTQAVMGKLTEEWREGKGLDDRENKRIDQISDALPGYAFKSMDFTSEGYQLVRMGNLYNNKLDLTRNPVYLPKDYDPKIISKYQIKKGDILLSLTGTKYKRDYGFAIKVDADEVLLLNQRIVALKPSINSRYFLYLLRDNIFKDQFFSFETGGVNQGNVGIRAVNSIIVPVPQEKEQNEIVKRVDALFALADMIESQYQSLKEKIDNLPQSVLNKAFKGELVPQDPNDESASLLMERIQAEKGGKG